MNISNSNRIIHIMVLWIISVTAYPITCDVNQDGLIDRSDLSLIFEAKNTPSSGAGDPRDADNNGLVNMLDSRQCVLLCTQKNCAIATNNPPQADAGPDQAVEIGDIVTLDGGGSNDVDNDPITYRWSLASMPDGSIATLSDYTSAIPVFNVDLSGTYLAQLIVNDGKIDSSPDTVTITANLTTDYDFDNIIDDDNCPNVPNPGQKDDDNNGIGNACEEILEIPQLQRILDTLPSTIIGGTNLGIKAIGWSVLPTTVHVEGTAISAKSTVVNSSPYALDTHLFPDRVNRVTLWTEQSGKRSRVYIKEITHISRSNSETYSGVASLRVTDEDDGPVSGAIVRVLDRQTVTDVDGFALIADLPPRETLLADIDTGEQYLPAGTIVLVVDPGQPLQTTDVQLTPVSTVPALRVTGPAGGIIDLGGFAQVIVPDGALDEGQTLIATVVFPDTTQGLLNGNPTIDLTPAQEFNLPITIRLGLAGLSVNAKQEIK